MRIIIFILMLIPVLGITQISPDFTVQVINSKTLVSNQLHVKLRSNVGYGFSDISAGDVYAVKSGSNIVRYSVVSKTTSGVFPGFDGVLTMTPLDGYSGVIPTATPTASGYIYRPIGGDLAPLDYLNQDFLNWAMVNWNLQSIKDSIGSGNGGGLDTLYLSDGTMLVNGDTLPAYMDTLYLPDGTPVVNGDTISPPNDSQIPLADSINFGGVDADTLREALLLIDARLDTAMNAQPSGQLAYGNSTGTGLTSDVLLRWDGNKLISGNTSTLSSVFSPYVVRVNSHSNGNLAGFGAIRSSNDGGGPLLHFIKSRGTNSVPTNYASGDITYQLYSYVYHNNTIKNVFSIYSQAYDTIVGSTTRVYGTLNFWINTLTTNESLFSIDGRYTFGNVKIGRAAPNIVPKGMLHIKGENALSGRNGLFVENYSSDSLFAINNAGVLKTHKYGAGNNEASDLGKTQSDNVAGYATDGTITEVRMPNGIYVPTATKNTATDTIVTIYTHLYKQNDTVMNVTGRLLVNSVTATGETSVQLTLPPGFTSNFSDKKNDITGVVTCRTTSGIITVQAAWPEADTSTDKIIINWIADGVEATRQEINFNINLRKI